MAVSGISNSQPSKMALPGTSLCARFRLELTLIFTKFSGSHLRVLITSLILIQIFESLHLVAVIWASESERDKVVDYVAEKRSKRMAPRQPPTQPCRHHHYFGGEEPRVVVKLLVAIQNSKLLRLWSK